MTDLTTAIARLLRHREWSERTRRAVAGDAELSEVAESAIRTGERVFQRIIKAIANDEADGKWH